MSRIAYADLGRPGAFTPSVRYTRTPQAEAPEPVAVDPAADAYGTGYREGHAAARSEAEAELMRERQERARIELAFARFDAESALALRENLRTTVLALCEDAVLPLACLTGAPLCDKDPITARLVNFEAIKSILEKRSPNQIIIFPTTNSGYGIGEKGIQCTEDTPLRPVSLYGQLKVDPIWDSIREDQRFINILNRLKPQA